MIIRLPDLALVFTSVKTITLAEFLSFYRATIYDVHREGGVKKYTDSANKLQRAPPLTRLSLEGGESPLNFDIPCPHEVTQ